MGGLWEPDDRYRHYHYSRQSGSRPFVQVVKKINWRKILWQGVASLIVFLLIWGAFQSQSPALIPVQKGIRHWFTEDYDFQPVLKMFMQIGLWGDTFERAAYEVGKPHDKATHFTVPVSGQISQTYGWIVGQDNSKTFNDGIVIVAPEGTPVKAALAGVVSRVAYEEALGRLVEITSSTGYTMTYAHCKEILVNQNDKISAGQVIARVGKTGNITVPQLFFRVMDQSGALDPSLLFMPSDNQI